MPGQNTIPSVCGPLATSLGSLKLMLQAILSQRPWLHDPAVVELPWRDDLFAALPQDGSKLTFGLLATDGVVNPQPAIRRALETVKDLITAMGHEIVQWQPPCQQEIVKLAVSSHMYQSLYVVILKTATARCFHCRRRP
jgi:amidase